MIKASKADKLKVVEILSMSFDTNKSVNFVVKQDSRRKERIRILMSYAFEICYMFGEVYLSKDRKACALILFSEKRKVTFRTTLLKLKLALHCIGISRIGEVKKMEELVTSHHPSTAFYHLWFLAVSPDAQKRGRGSKLLKTIIEKSREAQRDIYLETSTIVNIPWYESFGFKVVKEWDFGYSLFVFRRDHTLVQQETVSNKESLINKD